MSERRRNLLHKTKLAEFEAWLRDQGIKPMAPKGGYEVLRWRGQPGEPMPIIFDRHQGDHFTSNRTASAYVSRYIRSRKEERNDGSAV